MMKWDKTEIAYRVVILIALVVVALDLLVGRP